jgi:hypothetical protein
MSVDIWIKFRLVVYCFFTKTISSVADPDPDPDPKEPYVLGLLDPDPLVRGTDPDPAPSIIKQK